ncbi:hypothetical protein PACTADRAFT_14567 [Pachysolen tannophilus NRRL Y-2460]|uniref:Uncharacterized protein n=1 Tax=Pachysolen tannophilus NRRL Y-2460 TaxID=669874 RepID=A0A1E4U279_PACTA|nr:hypothetical protein PACTADRAFT_14567 [Pachysolen tannophilus NRRL Y-2460]
MDAMSDSGAGEELEDFDVSSSANMEIIDNGANFTNFHNNSVLSSPSATIGLSPQSCSDGDVSREISSNSIGPRKFLDERASTRIGQVLSKGYNSNVNDYRFRIEDPSASIISENSDNKLDSNSITTTAAIPGSSTGANNIQASTSTKSVKILKLKKISKLLYSEETAIQYGNPTSLTVGELICIGTSKGYIILFDYKQNLKIVLGKDSKTLECGIVTALAVSADSTYIASGFENGDIFLWNLSKPLKPALHVTAVTRQDLASGTREGHFLGNKIHQLSFVGKRHTALISSDVNGILCFHNGFKNILGAHAITKKILGKYNINNNNERGSAILASSVLPLGTSIEPTDDIGLVSVIAPRALVVISIYPELRTHFKIGRPKAINTTSNITGCLAWLPALKLSEGRKVPPKLVYCWSNVLTVLDVNYDLIKNRESDDESLLLKFENKKRWITEESIVAVQWINEKVISVLTAGHRLILINELNMAVLTSVDLLSKHILSLNLFSNNALNLAKEFYSNSFKVYRSKIFLLGKYEFFIGSLTNWADKLFDIMKNGDYIEALQESRSFYNGDNDNLVLYGLPDSVQARQDLLYDYIIKMVKGSLEYVFAGTPSTMRHIQTRDQFKTFLTIFLKICLDLKINSKEEENYYDLIFEKFKLFDFDDIFFETLEKFILKGDIVQLTPTILQQMVEYFISNNKGDELEELICLLDIKSLDIDLTVSLCRKNHLRDSLVFIWNVLLNDYITPLFDFINDIKTLFYDKDLDETRKTQLILETKKVYGYISYVLTGRQYPTERMIEIDKQRKAKLSLYYILFNGTAVGWPKGNKKLHITQDIKNEPAFPYLYLFLKFDCFEMLSSLNEAFEDDILNDDELEYGSKGDQDEFQYKVTRQYVIDVLLDLFNSNDFSTLDFTYLSIFVARNYPKFQQFVRLTDSNCETLIEHLCSYPDIKLKEDCELSLQSLLSVYHPLNIDNLISLFESAGFYDVLFNVYRSEQKFSKVLELWLFNKERLEMKKTNLTGTNYDHIYDKNSDIVNKCFELTDGNERERYEIINFVRNHFKSFINRDQANIVKVFNKYCPSLHIEILNINDDEPLVYDYLKCLFRATNGDSHLIKIDPDLKTLFIELLSKYDHKSLYKYLTESDLSKIDLENISAILKKNKAIDSLVFLLDRNNDHLRCIQEVVEYMNFLASELIKLINEDNSNLELDKIENELWDYLFLGIKICNYDDPKSSKKMNTNDLTINEQLWLMLIESTVGILRTVNNKIAKDSFSVSSTSQKILNTIKRLIQCAFTNLINSRSGDELVSGLIDNNDKGQNSDSFSIETLKPKKLSFFKIFTKFLNDSSTEITRLGDVRLILKEIFLSYSYEAVFLKLILNLVDDKIFREFEELSTLKLKGLTPKKDHCDACDKILWGNDISKEIYYSWRNDKLDSIEISQKLRSKKPEILSVANGKSFENSLAIVIFKCGHGYHSQCLNNLGVLLSALSAAKLVSAELPSEFGSYVNPNPKIYDNCNAEQLVALNSCANDVLTRLDVCKPDDLACECCALQSMNQQCFGLCKNSPSANFLDSLISDCQSLSEVNACGLPFKKNDNDEAKISRKGFRGIGGNRSRGNIKVEQKVKSVVGDRSRGTPDVKVKSTVFTEEETQRVKAQSSNNVPEAMILTEKLTSSKNNSISDTQVNASNATNSSSASCENSSSSIVASKTVNDGSNTV